MLRSSWTTPMIGIGPSWVRSKILGLLKARFLFPNGKSTIWGIHSEYSVFFWWAPNQKYPRNCGKALILSSDWY
jgi:hypothetical protein